MKMYYYVVVVVVVVVKILPKVAGEMHSPYIPVKVVSRNAQTAVFLQVMYGNR
jgi:hypothetical protein